MLEVRAYTDYRGRRPFYLWLEELSGLAQRRILRIVARMEQGNLDDTRSVGEGVMRRADFGPGYRIYFAWDGPTLIILLGGGGQEQPTQRHRQSQRTLE